MDYVAGFLTEYERYASRSQQSVAHAQKLAFPEGRERGCFDSTHTWQPERVPHFEKEGRAEDVLFRVYEGSYADFDAGWYGTVGVAIMLTLVLSWLSELACYFVIHSLPHECVER